MVRTRTVSAARSRRTSLTRSAGRAPGRRGRSARQPVTRAQTARRLADDRRKWDGVQKIRKADRRERQNRHVTGQLIASYNNVPGDWREAQAYWQGQLDREIADAARNRQEGAIWIAASSRKADQRRIGRRRRLAER